MFGQRFKRAPMRRVALQVGVTHSCFEFCSGPIPNVTFRSVAFLHQAAGNQTGLQSMQEDEEDAGVLKSTNEEVFICDIYTSAQRKTFFYRISACWSTGSAVTSHPGAQRVKGLDRGPRIGSAGAVLGLEPINLLISNQSQTTSRKNMDVRSNMRSLEYF